MIARLTWAVARLAKVRAMTGAVIPIKKRPDSLTRLKASARKLFVERGYHATRPQDIAREAGLGHGTFYLHYPDKRACFLAFVEDARQELNAHLANARTPDGTLEELIAATLNAIYDYSDSHPGVLRAAMTDEMVIDAEGAQAVPLLVRWGEEWAALVRERGGKGPGLQILQCRNHRPGDCRRPAPDRPRRLARPALPQGAGGQSHPVSLTTAP